MYFELYIDNLLYHVHLLHNVSKIRKNFVIRSKLYCHIIFYRNKIFQFIFDPITRNMSNITFL